MKKVLFSLLLLLLLAGFCIHGPVPATTAYIPEDQLKNMQWNRYSSNNSNFEVLSIDDQKGKYLYDNIDQIKSWAMVRWALANDNYGIKCKVICVPTQAMFKEFFGKDAPQWRVKKDGNQITELTIWVASDDPHWNTTQLTKAITELSLDVYEAKHNQKIGLWARRGMSTLNGDLPAVRQKLGNLYLVFDKDIKVYWSKELLEMTPDVLAKHPTDSAAWYDAQAACFCLMLYKEHGAKKFNQFLTQCQSNPEAALRDVYGYQSYAECDTVFKRYMYNLSCDITGRGQKVTPNSYLTWPLP
jgi:hypothetical protein